MPNSSTMTLEYVYHDRKMMKWMPFNALLEQGSHVSELLHGRSKKTMPTLSVDQLEELNYQLEEAYLLHQEITVLYYDSYKYKELTGYITNTDIFNKLIFINEVSISALQIIKIST